MLKYGIDFEETFSPVARFETVRLILCFAAQYKLPVFQFDVKSTFLNGNLNEEVYVSQPEGFITDDPQKVYKLKRLFMVLNKLQDKTNGIFRSENEPTLYVKRENKDFLLVCLYVDDMVFLFIKKNMPLIFWLNLVCKIVIYVLLLGISMRN